ncbi:hypothetical protein EP7_000130 [Isosphaeraceae bacterium EP7]
MFRQLEELEQLVRQAKAGARAQKLEAETTQAAEVLREAERTMMAVEQRAARERPDAAKAVEQAELARKRLDEAIREVAKNHLNQDPGILRTIEGARAEIDGTRIKAQATLDEIGRDREESKKALQVARDAYLKLRQELDELQPALAPRFGDSDRLVRQAGEHLPEGQVRILAEEVDDSRSVFGMLDREQQHAQLMIWMGRYRRIQDRVDVEHDLTPESMTQLDRIFPMLRDLSHQYMPGYIEAFSRAFTTDWEAYVADAQARLLAATEGSRRAREVESVRAERQVRDQDQAKRAAEVLRQAIEGLKMAMVGADPDSEEGSAEFFDALRKVVLAGGSSDTRVLQLVAPYQSRLDGKDFRALRRNLDRSTDDDARVQEDNSLRERLADLIAQTRGKDVLMIGGAVREDARRSLQRVFEFDELDWEPYEAARPAMLSSLEERIRNRTVDYVLILKEFVSHSVSGRLRPLCEEHGIPCLMIEHGYGASQVAEALGGALARSA